MSTSSSSPAGLSQMDEEKKASSKFVSLRGVLQHMSPFCAPGFVSNADDNLNLLMNETRVLVVGAGGLGCEILKNLALSGFRDIHVIDMDKVDVSNLNRQFLFREADVNHYKSEVAAKFVTRRCPGVRVQYHTCAIQDFPVTWYKQFNIVIAGLDNVAARQWLNQTLVELVEYDATGAADESTVIPLIDGGTEAFNGQSRLFLPGMSTCFECGLASMAPPTGYAICTIRNVPRIPEHCIAYALKMEWPRLLTFKTAKEYTMTDKQVADADTSDDVHVPLDKDDDNHMTWLYDRALERANQFKIPGVTYNLTMQVVKNIIPAVGSTNALIAASCCNEAFKYVTNCARRLNNYYMYRGAELTGIYAETIHYRRDLECAVCQEPQFLKYAKSATLQQVVDHVTYTLKLDQPSVSTNKGKALYQTVFAETNANLEKTLEQLNITETTTLVFNDKSKKTKKVYLTVLDE